MKSSKRGPILALFAALAVGGTFGVSTAAFVTPEAPPTASQGGDTALPALDLVVARLAADARAQAGELIR